MPLIPPDAGLLAQYRVRRFLAELGGVQVVIIERRVQLLEAIYGKSYL